MHSRARCHPRMGAAARSAFRARHLADNGTTQQAGLPPTKLSSSWSGVGASARAVEARMLKRPLTRIELRLEDKVEARVARGARRAGARPPANNKMTKIGERCCCRRGAALSSSRAACARCVGRHLAASRPRAHASAPPRDS